MQVNIEKTVTKIEANPLLSLNNKKPKKLRVAAYCRVSTDEEEQLNSYEAQIAYYTEAIAKNPSWTFAGIYADEGISGTATAKRKDFLRLMRDCERGKIDMILTKSISRFARNTVDSLSWVRKLRAMNIGVYFEEQAIDSLKAENEMLIGLFSVIAQAESENISANVRWGIQQSMKNGNFGSNFSCFGYRKGSDGVPKIVPEEAEIVRYIYDRYLDGLSIGQIQSDLIAKGIKSSKGKEIWSTDAINRLLKNEKYQGDLLLQKTYKTDCISKKTKTNRGELPKYLVSNNHPAIIPREKFNLVQMEMARRGSKHKKSSVAITEQGKYSAKYALSELLICGQCGSHYRRRQKTKNGRKQYVWRCINRIENGEENCDAVGAEEQKLQKAICRCLNRLFTDRAETKRLIESNLNFILTGNSDASDAYTLERKIQELFEEAEELMTMKSTTGGDQSRYESEIERKFAEIKVLQDRLEVAKKLSQTTDRISEEQRIILDTIKNEEVSFDEFDDVIIRRLVECIRVMKDRRIVVVLKGGMTVEDSF